MSPDLPSDASIIEARPAHLPEIAALAEVVWRKHYPGIISEAQIDYMLGRMYGSETMQAELVSGGVRYLRLVAGGSLIGFAAFGPDDEARVCKLHKLYLHPDHQRRGLGRHLMRVVETLAKAMGAERIRLQVNKQNTAAIEAYRRAGFHVVQEAVFDIGGGFVMDDFIMEKSLKDGADRTGCGR